MALGYGAVASDDIEQYSIICVYEQVINSNLYKIAAIRCEYE
jgi:hypothetical protein